jgi:CheY-like chemotaxis protein
MPGMAGLKFIELQKGKGCEAPNIAVMSATWSEEQYQTARELGCKAFQTIQPFRTTSMD